MQAAMGYINIEQNKIMGILLGGVCDVPTGNARRDPLTGWTSNLCRSFILNMATLMAIGLMIGAALTPYIYFKRKGWL